MLSLPTISHYHSSVWHKSASLNLPSIFLIFLSSLSPAMTLSEKFKFITSISLSKHLARKITLTQKPFHNVFFVSNSHPPLWLHGEWNEDEWTRRRHGSLLWKIYYNNMCRFRIIRNLYLWLLSKFYGFPINMTCKRWAFGILNCEEVIVNA